MELTGWDVDMVHLKDFVVEENNLQVKAFIQKLYDEA